MRKWILLVLAVLAVVGTWWVVRTTARFDMPWNQPTFGEVTKGDITVPITASGLIEPLQRIEIKSKASGEVIELPVREGDFVHAGQVLVVLKKLDEERSVDRAQAELDRFMALYMQAQISVRQAELEITSAQARLDQLIAEGRSSQFNLDKVREKSKHTPTYSEQEILDAEVRVAINTAQQASASSSLTNAQNAVETARENVKLQDAAVRSATKTLEDAQERLRETTLISRYDAIVTDVAVKPSMLIQSATQGFTGGTRVLELADVSKKIVRARVDESEYGRILNISPLDALPDMPGLRESAQKEPDAATRRTGAVKLTIDAFRDQVFEGRIERVEPQGRQNAGSSTIQFDVHLAITDPKGYMLPLGAQAQVEFTVDQAIDVLRVPAEAVKRHNDETGVWLQVPARTGADTRWGKKFVACRFGITDGEFTEVRSMQGETQLKTGDKVYLKLPSAPSDKEDE